MPTGPSNKSTNTLVISLSPKNADIYKYVDINKTEFTVRKRPLPPPKLIGTSVSSKCDVGGVSGVGPLAAESYDNLKSPKDVTGLRTTTMVVTTATSVNGDGHSSSRVRIIKPNSSPKAGGGHSTHKLQVTAPHHTASSSYVSETNVNHGHVTSFTVDRAQMLKNFHKARGADRHHRIF